MTEKQPVVLSIAGFDPSSGAGVTADIKTIAAHGCYGIACITAMTVQSTAGVRRIAVLDPSLMSETLVARCHLLSRLSHRAAARRLAKDSNSAMVSGWRSQRKARPYGFHKRLVSSKAASKRF